MLAAAEKSSIVRHFYQTFGGNVDYGIKEF